MAPSLIDVLCLAAAASQALLLWFRGGIFALPREYARAWSAGPAGPTRLLGELLTCPLCMSVHVTFLLSTLFLLPAALLPEPWGCLARLPLYTLAASGLVWLPGRKSE